MPGPQTTVIADTPVEVFRLSRADYDAVLRELPEERQASTLAQTVAVDEGGAIILPHLILVYTENPYLDKNGSAE